MKDRIAACIACIIAGFLLSPLPIQGLVTSSIYLVSGTCLGMLVALTGSLGKVHSSQEKHARYMNGLEVMEVMCVGMSILCFFSHSPDAIFSFIGAAMGYNSILGTYIRWTEETFADDCLEIAASTEKERVYILANMHFVMGRIFEGEECRMLEACLQTPITHSRLCYMEIHPHLFDTMRKTVAFWQDHSLLRQDLYTISQYPNRELRDQDTKKMIRLFQEKWGTLPLTAEEHEDAYK